MPNADDQRKLQTAFSQHQAGNVTAAANLYKDLITRDPQNDQAIHYLGVIEAGFGNIERAKALMTRSVSLQPKNVQFAENFASLLFQLSDYDLAIQVCNRALLIDERNVTLRYVLAISLLKLKRFEESAGEFDALLSMQPNHVAALNERSAAYAEIRKYDAALESIEKALALQPHYAEAHLNRGNICSLMDRYDDAIASYDKALSINPSLADCWLGRGRILRQLCRYEEALSSYDKALLLKPDLESAWLGRGNAFFDLKRFDEAFAAYDKAFSLNPELTGVEGSRLHTKMRLCDWSNFDTECGRLIAAVRGGKSGAPPFTFLAIPSSPDDQLQCAKLWAAKKYPPSQKPIWEDARHKHDRIRVAYVSADFREHPVSYLTAGMFECHDKSRFDVTAISLGLNDNSEMLQRLKTSFEKFVDARTYGDDHIANLVRSSEVDILVDLMGFTSDSRTGIFARRVAPIQVNYLGYLGTMGAEYIDYIIADRVVIPESQYGFYAEKIVHLPNSFQPTDRQRRISEKRFTRAEAGLPEEGFVFCCFNTNYKITPDVYDIWMRILKRVHGSVLWLVAEGPTSERNLRSEAAARGVSGERLIFAQRVPLAEHQARLQLAGLFLDTLPYNAGATASDMLWGGLPVLTHIGDTFVGRMAASLLNAIQMPELVATTPGAYEQMAIEFATHPEKLAAVKNKLAKKRFTAALFDTRLFTRHIEAAYCAMYERYQAKLPPDHIVIPN